MRVALVHDYLTQRGGAERVVLSLLKAFPEAPLYTSVYVPRDTFPEFQAANVRTLAVNRLSVLRRHHRLALPVLAASFGHLRVDAEVVLCSSSGWAHGVRTTGRKIVYCYSPARWLYQSDRYLPTGQSLGRTALRLLRPYLLRWDRAAAATADEYLTLSTAVQDRIRRVYEREAKVVPPPYAVDPSGNRQPVEGLEGGFLLCVSRLLPYKNVSSIVAAAAKLSSEQLVVVGSGPEERRLRRIAPENVRLLGGVSEAELRWLYAECVGVVAASYEDYGLTPLEGAAFGKPAAVLRFGGFLDTVVEGKTGVFFDRPEPGLICNALGELRHVEWDENALREHAGQYSEERFVERMRRIVLNGNMRRLAS